MVRPISNPPNPWSQFQREYFEGETPPARLELFEEKAKSILSENDTDFVPFRWSLNPYRGCTHGCAYCYARTSHQYLGFGAGTDFERKIVVKINAPALLREAFEKRSWIGERVMFSGNTDCYQGIEANYELTKGCLEVCLAYRNPVTILTRSTLIRRDVDLLSKLHRDAQVQVFVSCVFVDEAMARALEPWAPSPKRRFETIRTLAEAGIPVGIACAPVMPGLNDEQIPMVLEEAAAAGARSAFYGLVRLTGPVEEVFLQRLREEVGNERANRVENTLKELHGGQLYDPRYGTGRRDRGPRWEAVRNLIALTCKRLGLGTEGTPTTPTTFRRPNPQGSLF